MKVQELILPTGEQRYLVLDDNNQPIQSVLKFMKYLDSVRKSPNTQRTYCYGLRDYFTFLRIIDASFESASVKTLANFLSWLVNPTLIEKVQFMSAPVRRTETTINLKMSAVLSFYRFLFQFEYIDHDVAKSAYFDVKGIHSYKDFLYHINKSKPITKSVLKIKEPRHRVEIIPDEILEKIFLSTNNIRDLFLFHLLLETGLRIGEILSLQKTDIHFDLKDGHHISLVNRTSTDLYRQQKSGARNVYISTELIDLYDDYMYYIIDFDRTEALFVKIKGQSIGLAMNYQDVMAVFKRMEKKVNYHLHPHLFRHTHATKFYVKTKDIKAVQERLGHKQIQTTMNLYLHPSNAEIRAQWEKASDAFKMKGSDHSGSLFYE